MIAPPPVTPPTSRALTLSAAAGAVAAALLGALLAATAPRGVLLVVLLPVQTLLAVGWLTLAAVPARAAGVVIASAAGLAADLLLALRAAPGLGALAGVVGLGVVGAVLGQLLRSERSRVTEVLAAQCSAVLLAVAVAPPLALAALARGGRDVAAALVALALTVAAGQVGALLPRHRLVGRAGLGLLVGAGGGAALGALLIVPSGPVVAVVAAVATAVAELVVAVAAVDRPLVHPLGALLPFALMAPGVYVVGRVMLG